jgi:hypothetical protein
MDKRRLGLVIEALKEAKRTKTYYSASGWENDAIGLYCRRAMPGDLCIMGDGKYSYPQTETGERGFAAIAAHLDITWDEAAHLFRVRHRASEDTISAMIERITAFVKEHS